MGPVSWYPQRPACYPYVWTFDVGGAACASSMDSSATSAAPHDEPQVPPIAESTIHVMQPSAASDGVMFLGSFVVANAGSVVKVQRVGAAEQSSSQLWRVPLFGMLRRLLREVKVKDCLLPSLITHSFQLMTPL